MKIFEFTCGGSLYRYEDGWIHYKTDYNSWPPLCPVLRELNDKIESFTTEQLQIIMAAVIHSYGYGKVQGKKDKIQEFKRVFELS